MQHLGFVRPSARGVATRGWVHPALSLGFEVVTRSLLDGIAELDRVRMFEAVPGGKAAVISLEDVVADRIGQYASGSAPEMLGQARALFALYPDADLDYLERRIRYKSCGDHGLEILTG